MGMWCGENHCWVLEGMAMHFHRRLMKDTSMMHCVDLAGTSPKNKGKNYNTDPADWPVRLPRLGPRRAATPEPDHDHEAHQFRRVRRSRPP